ncbi:MAG TPA: serine/threonine-protein kinase, partial [Pyrinomonadaceae bacterium]|nr:serine/threonine-protein kinase [Pyrinomonadaceae bacterium]
MKFCSICQQDHLASVACPGVSAIVIEGYRAMNPISSGAFELHRAQENASGRTCLITVVASDDATALKFLDQAKHAARSFNPAVAEVYDAGRLADGRSYVAWEELEGRTIREILDNVGAPRLLESIQIVRQAAEALHSLHAAGLTHGRVNPESIIITRGRDERASVRLQIPDFGSAMRRSMFDNRFALDSALDSLRYYAPEQCGDGELGAQADIYSLGIVFYEMLAGRPPFDAAGSAGLIHKHRNEAPPEIKIDDFNLRMLVTHALTEALQKRPTARQASAGLFARQLRHIEQLATHTSTPPP